jgi:predicted short-subunit dehydrogenase-like oxidoreductase (DUF2520 family)
MQNSFPISFIGTGNVAWHLAQKLEAAGHQIHEIYSRKATHAQALAMQLKVAQPLTELDFSASKAKIFIIAVSDDAIGEVVSKLSLPPDALLVHTSGSQPLQSLSGGSTTHIGVFYPLQTFSKEKDIDFEHIPICLEAVYPEDLKILKQVAGSISQNVQEISSEKRAILHIAAVFACNFTNYLWGVAEKILGEQQISLDILQPLITETLEKAMEIGPQKAQTGPAIRGDAATMQRHLAMLKNHKVYTEIYELMSHHIREKD